MRTSAALAILLTALPASALAARPEARWVPAAYFDVLAPGNQLTHLRDARGAVCNPLAAAGVTCNGSYSSYASLGGRVGMYYETEDYRWGGSVGALTGGPERGRLTLTAAGGAAGQRTQSTTLRWLGEASQKFLIAEDWYANLGAGLGMAVTNQTTSCSASGTLGVAGGPCYSKGGTVNLGWVAWEIFPAFQYQELEFGLRYAGMARGARNPWNAWGASLGWHFE